MFFPHFTIVYMYKINYQTVILYITYMAMNVVIRVAYSSYVGQVTLHFDWFTTAVGIYKRKSTKPFSPYILILKNIEKSVFLGLGAVGGCSFTSMRTDTHSTQRGIDWLLEKRTGKRRWTSAAAVPITREHQIGVSVWYIIVVYPVT